MRIIPDDVIWSFNEYIKKYDTIEITDKELDDLYHGFVGCVNKEFSQKLREYIELKIAEKEKK